MDTSSACVDALGLSLGHVVDWQLAKRQVEPACDSFSDVRKRIQALEYQATNLFRLPTVHPEASGAQRAFDALNERIAILRAELAWRGTEARPAE